MGTRGHIVIRYKNHCYIFYNHWDSYFDGLGAHIVKQLRSVTPTTLVLWRHVMEHMIAHKFRSKAWKIVAPTGAGGDNTSSAMAATQEEEELQAAANQLIRLLVLSDRDEAPCFDMSEPAFYSQFDIFIEYVYVVCLDDEVFHATSALEAGLKIRWPIQDIPENWIDLADRGHGGTSGWVHKSEVEKLESDLSKAGFSIVEHLEYGGAASTAVVRAIDKDGISRIVKVVSSETSRDVSRDAIVAQQLLKAPKTHLVQVSRVVVAAEDQRELINSEQDLIAMKCYEGDTSHLNDGRWDQTRVTSLVDHIVKGIRQLHTMGYVHHDVKPRNVLFERQQKMGQGSQDKNPKQGSLYHFVLCDFEGACRPGTNKERWESGWEEYKRTPGYLPEDYENLPTWRIDYETFAKSFENVLPIEFFGKYQEVLKNRELQTEAELVAGIEKLVAGQGSV